MTPPPEATIHLLDGNVLVALADAAHVHHQIAVDWFTASEAPFATCPITQGTLLRMLLRFQAVADASDAVQVLEGFTRHPCHCFWTDALDYSHVDWKGVLGHRQVIDAYLVALARHHRARLATFDRGLAALHPQIAILPGN